MSRILGYITPVRAFLSAEEIYMQAASGRVTEALAAHFDKVCVCARVVLGAPPAPFDPPLAAPNLELIPQPLWSTTAGSLFHFFGIARAYMQTCRRADVLFVRGMCPYIAVLYLFGAIFRKPICHWIVGDPVALMQAGTRKGPVQDTLALLYALQDRFFTRLGRWMTHGAFICNGRELARTFHSPRTIEVASSTIRESEFFSRTDTCQRPVVRILFVGFIRPEKGIEYLLEALSQLNAEIPWELEIVGPRDYPKYGEKLDEIAAALGIGERVQWTGYVPNGQPLFDRMRAADIFVLPTLSEGTPHVLAEARANGLPCISTNVGGVPSTVTHGYDALLVPPKNATALARAMERVIEDAELRRDLIRNGMIAAREQTLDRFIAAAMKQLNETAPAESAAVSKKSSWTLRVLQYLWLHFITVATSSLPDLRPVLRLRGFLLKPAFKSCGKNFQCARNVTINFPNRLEIGRDVYIATGCWLHAWGGMVLEDEVQLGPYAVLVTGDHTPIDGSYRFGPSDLAPIRICRGAWVAAHTTVIKGVDIGRGALLAANSVATHDVPPFVMAGGVPAQVIREGVADQSRPLNESIATENVTSDHHIPYTDTLV